MSLSYKEFKAFFFRHGLTPFVRNQHMFSPELYNKLKDNLRLFDYESFLFFDELFSLYEPTKIRERMFDDDEDRNVVIKGINNYLKDEESYNRLQSIIRKISFRFINGDLFEDAVDGKFDNIFLSNLCTITSLENLKSLLQKLDRNNLNNGGSIQLGYLWNASFDSDDFKDDWKDIYKIPKSKELLKDFITEAHQIPGPKDILWEDPTKKDLVLIYRKK